MKIQYYIMCIMVLTCCKQGGGQLTSQSQIKGFKIIVNKPNVADETLLSSLIDSCYVVKLKNCKDMPIGDIDKVIFFDEKIFILDDQSQGIFIYDCTGNYKSHIHSKGKSKGEYYKIADFDINRIDSCIVIKDDFKNQLICYDFQGEFIRRFKHSINAANMVVIGKNKYGIFNARSSTLKKNKFQLFITSEKGKIHNKYLPFSTDFLADRYRISNFLPRNKDSIFCIDNYNNTIYSLNQSQPFCELYNFDFLSYNLPKGEHWVSKELDYNKYARIIYFNKTNTAVLLQYQIGKDIGICAYIDNASNHIIKLSPYSLYDKDDLPIFESVLWGKKLGVCNDFFVHKKEPYTFADKKNKTKAEIAFLKRFGLDKMKSTDNPVLVFIKLKHF